jgi:hypothetical protein
MSTTIDRVEKIIPQDVLVRGFRDRPAKLVALACAEGIVYATGDTNVPAIGFHSELVYAFDERLLAELAAKTDPSDLAEIWESADRFVPITCGEDVDG